MGRPTKLTEELIERIVVHTLKGISIESISALSGINPDSYYRWMKQGKQDIEEGIDSIFRVFRESVLEAQAEVEQRLLAQAIGTDEIGARWYLSRKMRKEYGDKQEIELSGELDIEIVWPLDEEDS